MIHPWYTTREDVKSATDVKSTALLRHQVDHAIEAGSRSVEGLLGRRFYPWTGTRYKDWPQCPPSAKPHRLELEWDELISLSTLVVGGVTIPSTDYYLRNELDIDEPPYTAIELDLTAAVTSFHSAIRQRSVAMTGVFGHWLYYEPAGVLDGAITTTTATTLTVSDSSTVGVGDMIKVDNEHMLVTDRDMYDTLADMDGHALTASMADVIIPLTGPYVYRPLEGETILLDSERMLIVDSDASNLIVKRAWDGTVLAAHTGSSTHHLYAPRTLTVVRGAEGTTAATHSTGAAVSRFAPPALVSELTGAYALNTLLQRSSGYARVSGEGDGAREMTGRGIAALEQAAIRAYARPGWVPLTRTEE